MTQQTDNEKLIEEARNRSVERARQNPEGSVDLALRLAAALEAAEKAHTPTVEIRSAKENGWTGEAVLAVLEVADPTVPRFVTEDGLRTWIAAPTDDERKALESVIWEVLEPRLEDVIDLDLNVPADNAVFAILVGQVVDAVAGFRRSEVPEPSVENKDEMHARGATSWDCPECGNDPEDCYCSSTPQGEPRHFAPYGSTNALCDETVPCRVAWDETTGEYANQRFTVKRDRTTCPECRWRMAAMRAAAVTEQGEKGV